jgi:hypothetical protein
VRGGVDFALSSASFLANFSEGNVYGAITSFGGMVSADEYLLGAMNGDFAGTQAAAEWVDANSTATGLMLQGLGESTENAAAGSAAESTVAGFAGMTGNPTTTAQAVGRSADAASAFENFADAVMGKFGRRGGCSQ